MRKILGSLACMVALILSPLFCTHYSLEAAATSAPQPLPDAIIAPWEKAGATSGWINPEDWHAPIDSQEDWDKLDQPGDIPAFYFKNQWMPGVFSQLPSPDQSFGLDLSYVNITNPNLKGFSKFSHLQLLDLDGIRVTDADLKQLAGLTQLQELDLDDTLVTDSGLKELAGLTNLKVVSLDGTFVTDAGVAELKKKLPKLVYIHVPAPKPPLPFDTLYAWRKAGAYPGWMNPVGWINVEGSCDEQSEPGDIPAFLIGQLTPGVISQLPAPDQSFGLYLSQDSNHLVDITIPILNGLSKFRHLQVLTITSIQMTDADVKQIASLTQLHALNLVGTQLTDEVLMKLAGLTQLKWLNINDNQVTGSGLKELASFKQLQHLDLSFTNATDSGLKGLAGFKQLQWLGLGSDDNVTDAGLKELAGLAQLRWLDLGGTEVTDAGMKDLAGLTQLQTLDLGGTQVTDAGLKELTSLTQLQTLDLQDDNQVTDAGVVELNNKLPNLLKINHSVQLQLVSPWPPLPYDICAAWEKAGAYPGWMTAAGNWDDSGSAGEPGEIPAFVIGQLTPGVISQLPEPDQSFGLWLRGANITESELKELSRFTHLQVLTLDTSITDVGLKKLAQFTQLQGVGHGRH
jgi:internalin A